MVKAKGNVGLVQLITQERLAQKVMVKGHVSIPYLLQLITQERFAQQTSNLAGR